MFGCEYMCTTDCQGIYTNCLLFCYTCSEALSTTKYKYYIVYLGICISLNPHQHKHLPLQPAYDILLNSPNNTPQAAPRTPPPNNVFSGGINRLCSLLGRTQDDVAGLYSVH